MSTRELPPIQWQPAVPAGEALELPEPLGSAMWASALRQLDAVTAQPNPAVALSHLRLQEATDGH
jgi:hypothetical protein